MAVKENASRQELRQEIERLQGEIATWQQNCNTQQQLIQKYQSEQEKQFIASPTYRQLTEERQFLKSLADLTDINIVKDREKLERDKQSVQQVYADNKAMMGQPEDYFIGITDCRHETEEWIKLRRQVAEGQGAVEAYKTLLEERDKYILDLAQKLCEEKAFTESAKLEPDIHVPWDDKPERGDERQFTVSYFAFWKLRNNVRMADDIFQYFYNRSLYFEQKQYENLKIKYEELKSQTADSFIISATGSSGWEKDVLEAIKAKLYDEIKTQAIKNRNIKIHELEKQLKEAESRRYDSYVGEDALSYFQLQQRYEELQLRHRWIKEYLQNVRQELESLQKKVVQMRTATFDEKVEMIGQTIEHKSEAKKATRNKTGRKETDDEIKRMVIVLSEQGISFRKIAEATGVSVATVSRTMTNYILGLYSKKRSEEQIIADTKIKSKVVHKMIEDHYLSQIFLKLLDENQSDESAIEATKECQKEFESRNVGRDELRAFYDCARDYPVLETMEEFTVVTEAKKVY